MGGGNAGFAAWVILILIVKLCSCGALAESETDLQLQMLVQSLLQLPTSFELHGTGTTLERTIASTTRKNQAAQSQVYNNFEWAQMVTRVCLDSLERSAKAGQPILPRYNESHVGHVLLPPGGDGLRQRQEG